MEAKRKTRPTKSQIDPSEFNMEHDGPFYKRMKVSDDTALTIRRLK